MDHLEELEHRSIYLIREAYHRFDPLGCLWSMGKDSTVLLHLVRKAFLGKFPFPVLHLDTGYKLAGIYRFRDRIAAEWGVPLVVVKMMDELLMDRRGNREGFPFDSVLELTNLREYYLNEVQVGLRKRLEARRSPW